MKTLTITAQPQPKEGWLHQFRNLGEAVYVELRDQYDVDIYEIDASFDEFHVGNVPDDGVSEAIDAITELLHEHFLDYCVFITVADAPIHNSSVIIVLDPNLGSLVCELTGWHPIRIIGSDANREAVDHLNPRPKAPRTFLPLDISLTTEEQWRELLDAIDRPMTKLNVIGAPLTEAARAALQAFDFHTFFPTPTGFLALKS